MPIGQGRQTRSFLSVATFDTKVPAGQVLQGVQLGRFSPAANAPLGQGSQIWSAVGVPTLRT